MHAASRIAAFVAVVLSATLVARGEEAAPANPAGPTVAAPTPGAADEAKAADETKPADVTELAVSGPLGEMALGDPKAPVTVIEYASMTCPHCQRFHKDTFPHLKEKYIDTGKVYFLFREYPLDELALAAIMLARCAPAERFFPTIQVLFEMQDNWAMADDPGGALFQYLQPMGFTVETFNGCLENQTVLDGVNWVRKRGSEIFGVEGTPTFFFNGQKQVGELSTEEVDEILAPML